MELLGTGKRDLAKAARIVKLGGLVAFPTDTVYGLGCDPKNRFALERLLSVKGRRRRPIPILVSSTETAARIAVMNHEVKVLASRFWPGALTLILKPRMHFPRELAMGRKTIGVRCPNNRRTLELIRKCGGLLTGTSANVSGQPSCRSALMVVRSLGDKIDAVIDGGPSPRGTESTVVRVRSGKVAVLRRGPIGEEKIRQVLGSVLHTAGAGGPSNSLQNPF
jgi:L-threonylcarbamoyladenylate synthase